MDEKEQEKADDDAQVRRNSQSAIHSPPLSGFQVMQLVSTAKGMLGLGEDDPPESDWLHMTKTDHEHEERIPMSDLTETARLCYSHTHVTDSHAVITTGARSVFHCKSFRR